MIKTVYRTQTNVKNGELISQIRGHATNNAWCGHTKKENFFWRRRRGTNSDKKQLEQKTGAVRTSGAIGQGESEFKSECKSRGRSGFVSNQKVKSFSAHLNPNVFQKLPL